MAIVRYVNDLGNGFSGYVDYGTLQVQTPSGAVVVTQQNGPTGADSFGRLRVTSPTTLFDSSHRYRDNGLWATSTGVGATYVFNSAEGVINLNTSTASGSQVTRETTRNFPYQPGKSLLVMTTFVMALGKTNLRQRVGYFSSGNGYYAEVSGTGAPAFVERTSVSGSVTETRVTQANWNIDPLNGSGSSGFTLDPTKAQILWADLEWLGVGTVRIGFVIDGKFIHCHSFHHANKTATTYITTASLPVRYEITNVDTTASTSTLKQICSTVLSEGGYDLRGAQSSIGTPVASPYSLTTASTFYPVISLRLKSANLDAIVILTALSLMGTTNNAHYNWRIVTGGTTTGGTWVDASANGSVEYNITGTSFTQGAGRIAANGYASSTNQSSTVIEIPKSELFKFQLERDSLANTMYEITLVVTSSTLAAGVLASLDWEEVTR